MAANVVHKAKKTKKQRKYGRNINYCKVYALTQRREKNKVKRLNKHLINFPGDRCATNAKEAAQAVIRGH